MYALDLQLGIKPVYPATPTFSDVPASSPYYGYIEAAFQKGITNGFTNGTFGPDLPLTRAEAAKYEVVAYGDGTAAQGITSTTFTDNASIPTALIGYVAEAAKVGLLKGFPNNTFQPMAYLTVSQEQHLLAQLKSAMSQSASVDTLKLTASSTDVGPGQFVTLAGVVQNATGNVVSTTPVSFQVVGSNSGEALILRLLVRPPPSPES
ncbi:S-layer domain protein, partial [mine drainage metagenome]